MEPRSHGSTVDPREALYGDFEPAPLQIGPDGGPIPSPAPIHLPLLIESLCDQGPCRRRHLLVIDADVEQPMDGSELTRPKLDENGEPIVLETREDGTQVLEQEPWSPQQTLRTCYPAPGVEMPLSNDTPVRECSLWDPEDPIDSDVLAREQRRRNFRARQLAESPPSISLLPDDDRDQGDVEDLNVNPTPPPPADVPHGG